MEGHINDANQIYVAIRLSEEGHHRAQSQSVFKYSWKGSVWRDTSITPEVS